LSFPATIPDRSTIWSFKNRLIEAEVLDEIWNELQHQIDARGLQVKRGVIQDATFITSDPGHARQRNHEVIWPVPDDHGTGPGQRKE